MTSVTSGSLGSGPGRRDGSRRTTCGDHGGVDYLGKPCENFPVRRVQEIPGRCRHHGDAAREPHRKRLARTYAGDKAHRRIRRRLSAAERAYRRAIEEAAAVLAATPTLVALAAAKQELDEAREANTRALLSMVESIGESTHRPGG